MIEANALRRMAREGGVQAGVAEKDYAITWLLRSIYGSKLSGILVFMGGTAIRKVYFPGTWRFSEDLDFVCARQPQKDEIRAGLEDALRLAGESGMVFSIDTFRETEGHIMARVQYSGPLGSKNSIKIDLRVREKVLLEPVNAKVKSIYPDLGDFKVVAYQFDEILAEKMRGMLQRGKSRDFYDVWRLAKERQFDKRKVFDLFRRKCEFAGVECSIGKIFELEHLQAAKEHWEKGLAHLTKELPDFEVVISDLREILK